ncbi:MAG TPA: hypothetical protein VJ761_10700 [Ktedonobacteraceae bacterium]|nr:hypothetical protein [Ktedonobacteraceae bacterium]
MESAALFEDAIEWLRENYAQFQFFMERDVVWTLHLYLIRQLEKQGLSYRIFHGFTIPFDDGGIKNVDLVLLNGDDTIELAAEFKYEPSHQRKDLRRTKFPVVLWPDLLKDIDAVKKIVAQKKAKIAYSALIDEGGHFINQSLPPGPIWKSWDISGDFPHHVSLLWLKVLQND